jgi:hypothetical protein
MERAYGRLTVFGIDDFPDQIRKIAKGVCNLTDMGRTWAMNEYGGLWMDADILVFKPIPYQETLKTFEFAGVGNGLFKHITNICVAGRKQSSLMQRVASDGIKRKGSYGGRYWQALVDDVPEKAHKWPRRWCFHPRRKHWKPYTDPETTDHPWAGYASYHLRGWTVKWLQERWKNPKRSFIQWLFEEYRNAC